MFSYSGTFCANLFGYTACCRLADTIYFTSCVASSWTWSHLVRHQIRSFYQPALSPRPSLYHHRHVYLAGKISTTLIHITFIDRVTPSSTTSHEPSARRCPSSSTFASPRLQRSCSPSTYSRCRTGSQWYKLWRPQATTLSSRSLSQQPPMGSNQPKRLRLWSVRWLKYPSCWVLLRCWRNQSRGMTVFIKRRSAARQQL